MFASLLSACGGLSSTQRVAADKALKALGKIKAATEVGANYQQYGSLVIEAKADVNEASRVLPKGDLNNELNATIEAYADALKAWQSKINDDDYLYQSSEPGTTLISKYSLQTGSKGINAYGEDVRVASATDALNATWRVASTHLDRVPALLAK